MKRLLYPMLLVAASLVIGAILTTITATTFASYAGGEKDNVIMEEQLTDAAAVSTKENDGKSFSILVNTP
jgi:hypothetical protein